MAIEFRKDRESIGDILVFEENSMDPLLEVDRGVVEFSDDYILPDREYSTEYGTAVGASNAIMGLKFTTMDGEEVTAEVFDPADGGRLGGEHEIYPLDGKNRPFTVDGKGDISLQDMAVLGMAWYVSRRGLRQEL